MDQSGFIGYSNGSSFNSVIVNGGGAIISSGDPASVLVQGVGSTWSNSASLVIGYGGSSNSLLITNLGSVLDQNGYIGYDVTQVI